jgi:hypothetical protein
VIFLAREPVWGGHLLKHGKGHFPDLLDRYRRERCDFACLKMPFVSR